MPIALIVFVAVAALVAAHLVVLPLLKSRAVLFRGGESTALAALVLVCIGIAIGLASPPAVWLTLTVTLLFLQAVIVLVWRPWLIIGLSSGRTAAAVEKASRMVRLKTERHGNTWQLDGIGRMLLLGLPGLELLIFRVERTKKLVLFQNVLRKCVQNYTLGSSAN